MARKITSGGSPAQAVQPPYDEIAKLAYFYWEERGCGGGSPEGDWFRAERDLKWLGSIRNEGTSLPREDHLETNLTKRGS